MGVLVNGHKSFIGSVIVPALPRDRIDVDGMHPDLHRDCTFAGSLASVPEIEGDIRDAAPADLEGSDAIIHLAALPNDPLGGAWFHDRVRR
jgi:nucleoside-diphosphate-sugar epimerase